MISSLFANLVFLNPWILAALGALPVLWYLLRVTPPAAKHIIFPSARFLKGLVSDKQTPSHTPWWLLLLRMIIAALIILGLAHPIYNPAQSLPHSGGVRIVVDNGWEAAQTWQAQMKAAKEILAKAGRENREIYIATTAPKAGKAEALSQGPMTAAKAEGILEGLEPMPWDTDYSALNSVLKENKPAGGVHSYWFASGLEHGGFNTLIKTLQSQGGLTFTMPSKANLPITLTQAQKSTLLPSVSIINPQGAEDGRFVNIHAMNKDGTIIDQKTITLTSDTEENTVEFDVPETLKAQITQFRIAGATGAGGVFILDELLKRRSVGLFSSSDQVDPKPFIEARYYIKRALEPFADMKEGSIESLIDQDVSAIILLDVASMAPETLERLENWVRAGGLLIRFAGPNMAQIGSQNFLTPVPLQAGERSLDGSLTWDEPSKIAAFEQTSPLYGITIHEDILVRQQILATPGETLEQASWARLEDGTPLITADDRERGLIVMIHTTAGPEWSDLPLSGVFVEILKRTLSFAGSSQASRSQLDGSLQPIWVLDGFARQTSPDASVLPIAATKADTVKPGPTNPPGLYGRQSFQVALNIGPHIKSLEAVRDLPLSVRTKIYGDLYEQDLLPYFLYAALLLLLVDWLIMLVLSLGLGRLKYTAATLVMCVMFLPQTLHAQALSDDLKYAANLYLAYIPSGDPAVDATARIGLENLADVLEQRTSVEPGGVAEIDLERDNLSFFPLIYWPISGAELTLSSAAIQKIQHYLNHGGTILFDTRDQNLNAGRMGETQNARNLRLMTRSLSIPSLQPIADDHVLSRSFYLLQDYPGLHTDGVVWIEGQSTNGRDGVSSVIIGSHDWAAAWAIDRPSKSSGLRGGARQQEMAYRFGVNLMMYALTGNYKADQVHVPHILERLGQ